MSVVLENRVSKIESCTNVSRSVAMGPWTSLTERHGYHGYTIIQQPQKSPTTAVRSRTTSETVMLGQLDTDDATYLFTRVVPFIVTHNEGVCTIRNNELGIFVFEKSERDAFETLGWQFEALWEDFALEGVAPLAPSAIALRDSLRMIVKKVKRRGVN